MQSRLNTIVVGLIILIIALSASPTLAKEPIQVTRGQLITYAVGLEQGYDISGQTTMVRSAAGYTSVTLKVQGLAPNTDYRVQVHNQTCHQEMGGGYYQHEVGAESNEANEIRLPLTTNSGGSGYNKSVSDFVAHTAARSLVIQDTEQVRLACADLRHIAVSPYTFGTQKIQELTQSASAKITPADPTFLAGDPKLMEADLTQSASTKITPADSTFLAGDPELMEVQQYELVAEDSSGYYAANPELSMVQRYQVQIMQNLANANVDEVVNE